MNILWLAQSAIPHVSAHARVPTHPLEIASNRLKDADGAYSAQRLSQAFRRCEKEHPGLASWLEENLSKRLDAAARGLGASMAMTIWVAFAIFAGKRLRSVKKEDCESVESLVRADVELRREDPSALVEYDDIIAAHQPAVAHLIREKVDETLAAYAEDIDVDDVDAMYQMLLVEVLVLSYAVEPLQRGSGSFSTGPC